MHAASLSRGDKRRLEMAMCLVQEPKLLLLDEPTAGMARADTNNTIDLLKEIKASRPITMAIIEHDMHVVFCWPNGSPCWRRARRWSRTRPTTSRAIPRSAKPISARTLMERH